MVLRNKNIQHVTNLSNIPHVKTVQELLIMKFMNINTSQDKDKFLLNQFKKRNIIKDTIKRKKNNHLRYLEQYLYNINIHLKQTAKDFPELTDFHPFEKKLIELTITSEKYENISKNLLFVYTDIYKIIKKNQEIIINHCKNNTEIDQTTENCTNQLKLLLNDNLTKEKVDFSVENAKVLVISLTFHLFLFWIAILRRLPSIHLNKPLLAFFGAPNVGKSSLVRALSSGKPEIANYPFTTRRITMGHIYHEEDTLQIADTPGLWYRSDDKRNYIEKIALAILMETNCIAAFVLDPSEHCGTNIKDQLNLREEMIKKFKCKNKTNHMNQNKREWMDIISKEDLLNMNSYRKNIDKLNENDKILLKSMIHVSTKTKRGLSEVSNFIINIMKKNN